MAPDAPPSGVGGRNVCPWIFRALTFKANLSAELRYATTLASELARPDTRPNGPCLLRNGHLKVGYHLTIMNNQERTQRQSELVATIKDSLPDFVHACSGGADVVLIHQDAFAADYQEDEYALLGRAIKYAGLQGKEIRVVGKNRGTLGENEKIR